MVRQISLSFAHSMIEGRPTSEPKHIASSLGFILSDSYGAGKRLATLTPVSVPFWIVQVSSTESILLSGISDRPTAIEFTENTALSHVRKSLSETVDSRDIPKAVETALASLGNVEHKVEYIKHLELPETVVRMAEWFEETEPTSKPNRPELRIDSQGALSISQQFQRLRELADRRNAAMEELQKLADERISSQVDNLTNLVKAEKERWKRRVQSVEEIVNLETAELTEKKKDVLSDLEMKYRISLRALTAEFARESTPVEQFFGQLLDKIRESRIAIGQKGEDIDGAIEEFDRLVNFLADHVAGYTASVEEVKGKATQTLEKIGYLTRTLNDEKTKMAESLDSQIREHQHRIVEFDLERTKSENELEDLRDAAEVSVSTIEKAIHQRLDELKIENQKLAACAFESNRIKNLAPLTFLDIDVFVATYGEGEIKVFTPAILPSDRFSMPLRYTPVDRNLDGYLQSIFTDVSRTNSSFRSNLQKVCVEGNMLLTGGGRGPVMSGLDQLQSRQLLKEGVRERAAAQWDRYAGKCPKCGTDIAGAGQFCLKCGAKLS
jgi:hypothetical protein